MIDQTDPLKTSNEFCEILYKVKDICVPKISKTAEYVLRKQYHGGIVIVWKQLKIAEKHYIFIGLIQLLKIMFNIRN